MKIHNFIVGILIVCGCNAMLAQDADPEYATTYTQQLEIRDKLKVDLQDQKDRLKELEHEVGPEGSKLIKALESKKKELEKKEAELRRLQYSAEYQRAKQLEQDRALLLAQIASLRPEIDGIANQIKNIDADIAQNQDKYEQLQRVQGDVSRELVGRYSTTLNLPFSQLSFADLDSIREQCRPYARDQKVQDLIAKANKLSDYKSVYDKAVRVANSKYDKMSLASIRQSLAGIRDVSQVQWTEIRDIHSTLSHYEAGIEAFMEFILRLNGKREGNPSYSKYDLDDDLPRIFSKDDLQGRIESETRQVPYLKKAYDDYLSTIKAKPTSHPDIEIEILSNKP